MASDEAFLAALRAEFGDTIHMRDFAGKYVLCVNVASRCGFTPQYKPLQELYERYSKKYGQSK